MMARADEAVLLRGPEAEAHPHAGLMRLPGKLQCGLEHRRRTAAIVVDARSLRYTVKVCANDDQGAITIGGDAGQHVAGHSLARQNVDSETHAGAVVGLGCEVERATNLVSDPGDRNG